MDSLINYIDSGNNKINKLLGNCTDVNIQWIRSSKDGIKVQHFGVKIDFIASIRCLIIHVSYFLCKAFSSFNKPNWNQTSKV